MPISTNNFSFATFLSVDFGESSGSGFRLIHNETTFIVTAKHVVFNKETLRTNLWIKSRNFFGEPQDGYSAKVTLSNDNVFTFDNLDIVLIKMLPQFEYEVEYPGNNDISFATLDDVVLYDAIQIAKNIFLIGFPSSLTVDDFYEVDRPLLRTGIIAGKNISNNTFVIDSLAYYGVSGGPIVQTDEQNNIRIIGIASRYVPFITEWRNRHESSFSRQDFFNSGYAVCIPMDRIVEKINEDNNENF